MPPGSLLGKKSTKTSLGLGAFLPSPRGWAPPHLLLCPSGEGSCNRAERQACSHPASGSAALPAQLGTSPGELCAPGSRRDPLPGVLAAQGRAGDPGGRPAALALPTHPCAACRAAPRASPSAGCARCRRPRTSAGSTTLTPPSPPPQPGRACWTAPRRAGPRRATRRRLRAAPPPGGRRTRARAEGTGARGGAGRGGRRRVGCSVRFPRPERSGAGPGGLGRAVGPGTRRLLTQTLIRSCAAGRGGGFSPAEALLCSGNEKLCELGGRLCVYVPVYTHPMCM